LGAAIRDLRQVLAGIDARTLTRERQLRTRAEALMARLQDVPVAMLVAGNRGRFIETNAAATKLTGYGREELLTMTVSDLAPPGEGAATKRLWPSFLKRGSMSGAYRLRRKDGRVVMARYAALAHVLPGLHVSILAESQFARRRTVPATRRAPHKPRGKRLE
jgi:PAS domain S-box-containing protein